MDLVDAKGSRIQGFKGSGVGGRGSGIINEGSAVLNPGLLF